MGLRAREVIHTCLVRVVTFLARTAGRGRAERLRQFATRFAVEKAVQGRREAAFFCWRAYHAYLINLVSILHPPPLSLSAPAPDLIKKSPRRRRRRRLERDRQSAGSFLPPPLIYYVRRATLSRKIKNPSFDETSLNFPAGKVQLSQFALKNGPCRPSASLPPPPNCPALLSPVTKSWNEHFQENWRQF